ncbi:MAG: sensor histidine kinase [Polyangiales bacterium]
MRAAEALPPPAAEDWSALEAHSAQYTARMARAVALFIMVFIFLFWGLDLMIRVREPAEQVIYTRWRLSMLFVFGAMFVTLSRWRLAQRHPVLASAPFTAAACASLAYLVGHLGGLERPFFNMLCTSVFVPIVAPGPLPSRVAFILVQSAGLLAGFFLPRPHYADTPEFLESLFFLGTLVPASVVVGHCGYINFCFSFFQGLKLERTALELDTLNRELGVCVRDQTASLRQLAEHLQVVQEDERGRLARELHDELGQRLSALRFVVARTRRLADRDPATVAPSLTELDSMVDGALDCTKHIVSGLRPPLLDQVGLVATIEWLARRVREQTGIQCTLDLFDEIDGRQDPVVSLAAYRAIQESVTNVTRHAGATRVFIRLRGSAERLDLEVCDDGRGFPTTGDELPSAHNGLLGMRERAVALGGALHTDNVPTGGARVRLTLPRSRHNAQEAR